MFIISIVLTRSKQNDNVSCYVFVNLFAVTIIVNMKYNDFSDHFSRLVSTVLLYRPVGMIYSKATFKEVFDFISNIVRTIAVKQSVCEHSYIYGIYTCQNALSREYHLNPHMSNHAGKGSPTLCMNTCQIVLLS